MAAVNGCVATASGGRVSRGSHGCRQVDSCAPTNLHICTYTHFPDTLTKRTEMSGIHKAVVYLQQYNGIVCEVSLLWVYAVLFRFCFFHSNARPWQMTQIFVGKKFHLASILIISSAALSEYNSQPVKEWKIQLVGQVGAVVEERYWKLQEKRKRVKCCMRKERCCISNMQVRACEGEEATVWMSRTESWSLISPTSINNSFYVLLELSDFHFLSFLQFI